MLWLLQEVRQIPSFHDKQYSHLMWMQGSGQFAADGPLKSKFETPAAMDPTFQAASSKSKFRSLKTGYSNGT